MPLVGVLQRFLQRFYYRFYQAFVWGCKALIAEALEPVKSSFWEPHPTPKVPDPNRQ